MKRASALRAVMALLLCSVLATGCQSFRPRGYQPPPDSPEYLRARDRGASDTAEVRDTHWAQLIAELLNWAARSNGR